MNHPASSRIRRPEAAPERGTASASPALTLWFSLPADVAKRFRPHMGTVAGKILTEIQGSVPEYAQPLEGQFGAVITRAIEKAVVSCIDSIEDLRAAEDDWVELFREVGRRVFLDGRSLNSLQAAYRVGGRAAWRYISAFGQALRLPAPMLCVTAEAIFAYVDEISSCSVEGYTMAQARAAGTLERRRHRLLELILATPPSSPQTIASMAAAANWPLPDRVTVVALEPRDGHDLEHPAPSVPDDVLLDLEGARPCLVTADPARDLRTLRTEMTGWRAAVGPSVRLADAATSLHWAYRTMDLVRRGIVEDAPITRAGEHLSKLWLLLDEFLLDELTRQALEPLDGLTPKQQVRLGETLLAWLDCDGSTPEIAGRLKIHPQTVRYRLSQLVDLFGNKLSSSSAKFDMQVALRAHRLLGTRPPGEDAS
ncbi:helix-turn-helix domain-containing protein [Amycolatopsis minnesotensis]|uniref:PucR family transcriptional regulator n=1 Tax=Amycolatopsis minnesotensis TaxID=337894 RepID=A0ABN2QKV2_9PSEU